MPDTQFVSDTAFALVVVLFLGLDLGLGLGEVLGGDAVEELLELVDDLFLVHLVAFHLDRGILYHGLIEALPELALFGLVLAWLRSRTGSVYPGMLAHATFNTIGLLSIFF